MFEASFDRALALVADSKMLFEVVYARDEMRNEGKNARVSREIARPASQQRRS
jgi:hypothetical protein